MYSLISGTSKVTFPNIFFQNLAIRASHKVYKHPNVKGFLSKFENPEKKFFKKFKKKIFFSKNFKKNYSLHTCVHSWISTLTKCKKCQFSQALHWSAISQLECKTGERNLKKDWAVVFPEGPSVKDVGDELFFSWGHAKMW